MSKHSIIIDCDPGQDDAICLLLALSSPESLNVLGITTVAGNVPLVLTQRNARLICELANRDDVPVFAGCERPLKVEPITAEAVHGSSGVDGLEISEPSLPLQATSAVDFLIATLLAAPDDSITLVPIGPLTNIATALLKEPSITSGIREIVLMGGAMREGGNTTPSAEFNIRVDPHAAQIVFDCGRPLTVMGLDVTHQVPATRTRIERIRALNNRVATATADMLSFFSRFDSVKYGADGAPLHDPCTIAFLLEPALFDTKTCNVAIETESPLTLGHTAVDFWGVSGREANCRWAYNVNADGFYSLLTDRLSRFGDDST